VKDYSVADLEDEAEMARIYGLIESKTEELARKGNEMAILDAGYKIAFAKARKHSEGSTVQAREDDAVLACQDVLTELTITEQEYRNMRQLVESLYRQVEVLRTISANKRVGAS
jgi:hypothetical protein